MRVTSFISPFSSNVLKSLTRCRKYVKNIYQFIFEKIIEREKWLNFSLDSVAELNEYCQELAVSTSDEISITKRVEFCKKKVEKRRKVYNHKLVNLPILFVTILFPL